MMHIAYPNIAPGTKPPVYRACVRYRSMVDAPGSPYTVARPDGAHVTVVKAGVRRLVPAWDDAALTVELFEKVDTSGAFRGRSQELALFLALIRCVHRLVLDGLEEVGDLWCTGEIELPYQLPKLSRVDPDAFMAKLQGFLSRAPQDRIFLVPDANIWPTEFRLCRDHGVRVLTLAAFQQQLAAALAAGVWRDKVVVQVHYDELPTLVDLLFARPPAPHGPGAAEIPPRRPYKALAAFDAVDTDLFCGREQEIRQVLSLLPTARLLVLHGASGTGKTSLLQAGVLPRLPPEHYVAVRVRVGDEAPTPAIISAIVCQLEVAQAVQDRGLIEVLRTATTALHRTLVVVLDPFEEFFLRFPIEVRRQFHRDLGQCLATPTLPVHFLLAIREDYAAQLDEFRPHIPDPLAQRLFLTRLTAEQATAAVVEPARRLHLPVEEAFVSDILLPQLQDAEGTIDPPVLQLVCDALYAKTVETDAPTIGATAYHALGDVRTWLEHYLTETLRYFGPDQPTAREILKVLVTAADTKRAVAVDTKRAVEMEELQVRLQTVGVVCEADTLEAVFLRRLVQVRLVRADEAEGRTRYELIHEFLVPPIAQWITPDEREHLMALEVVARAYEGYRQTGILLERQTLTWLARFQKLVLPPAHQAFVARSQQQQRRRRRRLGLTVGAGLLAVALVTIGLVYQANQQLQVTNVQLAEEKETAQTQRQNAEAAARDAEAQTRRANRHLADVLVEKGTALLAEHKFLHSYLLGAKALLLDPASDKARSLAYVAAVSAPYVFQGDLSAPANDRFRPEKIAFSPDGHLLAVVSWGKPIQLWDVPSGTLRTTIPAPTGVTATYHERITALAFSLDGHLLAAVASQTLWLWTLPSGDLLRRLPGPLGTVVTQMVFSPDGSTLAMVFSPDGSTLAMDSPTTLRLWTVTELSSPFCDGFGMLVPIACPFRDQVLSQDERDTEEMAFSPDGRTLAVKSRGGTISLWGVPSGALLTTISNPKRAILGDSWAFAFSLDGRTMAVRYEDRTIAFWGVPSGALLTTIPDFPFQGEGGAFALSPDGRTLAAGSDERPIQLWDVPSGTLRTTIHTPGQHGARKVVFSPDGRTLVIAGTTLELWSQPDDQFQGSLPDNLLKVDHLAFSPDGRFLAYITDGHGVRLWRTNDQSYLTLPSRKGSASVAFSPDGSLLAAPGERGPQLWTVPRGQLLATLAASEKLHEVAFSPHGALLAAAGEGIQLWTVPSGQRVAVLAGPEEHVGRVAFSPAGDLLAAASVEGPIRLWAVPSGQARASLPIRETPALDRSTTVPFVLPYWMFRWQPGVAFSPDGHLLAAPNKAASIELWTLPPGQWPTTLPSEQGRVDALERRTLESAMTPETRGATVTSLAFSPQSDFLIAAFAELTLFGDSVERQGQAPRLELFRLSSGQRQGDFPPTPRSPAEQVTSLAFSPDGGLLAMAAADGTVQLWGVAAGRLLGTLPGNELWKRGMRQVAFSPDGALLAVAAEDGLIRLWPQLALMTMAPEALFQQAQRATGISATDAGMRPWMEDATQPTED